MRKYDKNTITSAFSTYPVTEKVRKAIEIPLKRYSPLLNNYIFIVEENEITLLFPLNDLNKLNKELKAIVVADIENNIKNSGLKIKEEKVLVHDKYRVGFMSQSFVISAGT